MLNEIDEYEQYILSPEKLIACKNRRLKYYTLIKQNFGGLERAMTIIARHFIFDTSVGFNEDELREILKAWCGFKHEAKTTLPEHFDGWLNNYIRRVLLLEAVQSHFKDENFPSDLKAVIENNDSPKGIQASTEQIKNLLGALVKLADRNKNFSKNLFGSSNAEGETYFRAITYDRIIANALLVGKLRRYYLSCDEELFTTKKILKANGKKLNEKDKDMVLKMTAEYLLQRRHTTQNFIVTNNADIANWLLGSEKSERLSEKRENYLLAETQEKIFEVINIEGINAKKVKLHPEWAGHFRLIEEDSNVKWGRIFFSDIGSSEPLKESVQP